MKKLRYLAIPLSLFFLINCEKDPEPEFTKPVDIFVLGSSFTNQYVYYFQLLSDSIGDSIHIGEASIGNAGLQVHIEESNTVSKIAGYDWDYVMIQESGYMGGITEEESRESTFKCVEMLVDTIRAVNPGARIGLFMTQAYERGHEDRCPYDPEICTYEGMQARIIDNYILLAKEFDLELAAVGYHWQKFSEEYPNIRLFSDDHSHGSPAGRYLTACIIHTTVFQQPVSSAISTRNLSKAASTLVTDYVNDHVFENEEWERYYQSVD